LSISHGLKNTKSLIGLSFFLIACLIIFSHLWKIVVARADGIHFNPDQLLWYITLNEWVLIALPEIQLDMEHDLRSGRLAYLLPKPISYLGGKIAEGIGTLFLNLTVLGIVGFLFSWLWSGYPPFSFLTLCISIFLGYVAGFVALIFQVLIGLSAFWLREVAPFNWIWEKLLFVFGGLILPLSTYPLWMQKIAAWTPFSCILGTRSALALDASFYHITVVITSLFGWALVGLALTLVTYRRGLRILNIEGG
jgi:ABC-2 type transport system permease protein